MSKDTVKALTPEKQLKSSHTCKRCMPLESTKTETDELLERLRINCKYPAEYGRHGRLQCVCCDAALAVRSLLATIDERADKSAMLEPPGEAIEAALRILESAAMHDKDDKQTILAAIIAANKVILEAKERHDPPLRALQEAYPVASVEDAYQAKFRQERGEILTDAEVAEWNHADCGDDCQSKAIEKLVGGPIEETL